MRLSLVDLSVVPPSGDRHHALLNTLDMAQHAERWGYTRVWLAEHHATAAMAGRAPEVVIPFVAAGTRSIRVGSGSVLLNHYSPFKVAEVFSTLEELFPGRIDMGIGRATTGPISDIALQRNRSYRQTTDDSGEQLAELVQWMDDSFPPQHPFHRISVYKNGTIPPLWLLGSSPWSASAAAHLGLRYAFAGFINPGQAYEITQRYRQEFQPSPMKVPPTDRLATSVSAPELILSLSVYCAPTVVEAARLAAPVQLMMRRLMAGDIRSPLEEETKAIELLGGLPEAEAVRDARYPPRMLIGTPATVADAVARIAEEFGADEIMVQCVTANHQARLRSYELLAQALGVNAAQ